MGSSASIAAHATLNAAKTRKPKITFHYEKPITDQEGMEVEDTTPPPPPPAPSVTQLPEDQETPPSLKKEPLAISPTMELDAAVTRYFPLVKPLPPLQLDLPSAGPPPQPAQNTTSKDKQTKENYYYSCTVCSKSFMFKASLSRHMARHSGGSTTTTTTTSTTTTPSPTEEPSSKPARPFTVLSSGNTATSEVRYQLKDPRLYEQQAKISERKAPRPLRSRPTVSPTAAPTTPSKPRTAPTTTTAAAARKVPCTRELLLGRNVLAICSCLKCNSSFDDVDKLKEHIQRCQGYLSSRASNKTAGNSVLQKECNVR